ncbi:hypothetical protein IWZ03DRAFT_202770 [Phyllosticta citriasiana]|uniref:Uncharacterized protein n=1 Tax=Phyllosticta citriasiana TaxID=595635 RepID=A0ABR1KLK2_9PEZI
MYPPLLLPHTGAGMWWRIRLAFARQSVLQCSSQSDVCNIGITAIVNAHTAFHARFAPTHTSCSRLDWSSPLLACLLVPRSRLSLRHGFPGSICGIPGRGIPVSPGRSPPACLHTWLSGRSISACFFVLARVCFDTLAHPASITRFAVLISLPHPPVRIIADWLFFCQSRDFLRLMLSKDDASLYPACVLALCVYSPKIRFPCKLEHVWHSSFSLFSLSFLPSRRPRARSGGRCFCSALN